MTWETVALPDDSCIFAADALEIVFGGGAEEALANRKASLCISGLR